MAAAEGAVDAYTHVTGEKENPMPPVAGRHPSAASGGGQDRRLRVSRCGRGRKTPPYRRTVPLAGATARHRLSRLGGGPKKLGAGH